MHKKKKRKAVMVDGIPIKPISPAEHRRLDRRIKKKYEKLRRHRLRSFHHPKSPLSLNPSGEMPTIMHGIVPLLLSGFRS